MQWVSRRPSREGNTCALETAEGVARSPEICDSRSPSPGAGSTVGRARMLHPALEALFLFCKMKFGTLISLAVAGIKRASGRKIFNSVLTPAGRSVNMRRCWRRRAGLGLGLGLYRGQNWGAGRWDLGNHLVECFSNPAVIRIAWKLPVLLCWADTCTKGSGGEPPCMSAPACTPLFFPRSHHTYSWCLLHTFQ